MRWALRAFSAASASSLTGEAGVDAAPAAAVPSGEPGLGGASAAAGVGRSSARFFVVKRSSMSRARMSIRRRSFSSTSRRLRTSPRFSKVLVSMSVSWMTPKKAMKMMTIAVSHMTCPHVSSNHEPTVGVSITRFSSRDMKRRGMAKTEVSSPTYQHHTAMRTCTADCWPSTSNAFAGAKSPMNA